MNNILIIPARGGSKRIPKKNIKEFNGRPIIEITLKKVMELDCFSKVIVSTDSQEISLIARQIGAEVPFIRPANISGDFTTTREVIVHAITWYRSKGIEFDHICCLYPTTPLLKVEYLLEGINLFLNSDQNNYIFSATSYPHPVQRAFFIDEEGYSRMYEPHNYVKRTQDLKASYHDAGQFYIASADTWINKINIFEGGKPLIIPRWRTVDIDTSEDWIFAEKMYKLFN